MASTSSCTLLISHWTLSYFLQLLSRSFFGLHISPVLTNITAGPTANIRAVLSVQTQKADYCIISSKEATLFIPILGAKPRLTGFTTHCIRTGQKKEKGD